MKQKAFPVVLVLVIVAFLSTIFFASANLSYAASGSKKSPAVTRPSAVEHTEAQIKELQGALNITEAQQALWNNLVAVMRENAKEMEALNKERAENKHTEPMNAVEHMKFHSQITQVHLTQMNKLIPPFEAFYSSMSDQQKNITNIIFQSGKYEKHKKHHKK